jgi:hypothetical protein
LIPIRVSNIYVSNELSRGCACLYYDLKEDWEPDFEALEKLDLTKVKLWIGYPQGAWTFEKFVMNVH